MANGKNMNLFAYKFVNDAVGPYNQLAKSFKIRWYSVETFGWNIWAREREKIKLCNSVDDLIVPANGIFVRELFFNRKKNVLK